MIDWYWAIFASLFEVFEKNGLLEGEKGKAFQDKKGDSKIKQRVVISSKCIKSMRPYTVFEFGLLFFEILFGKDKKKELQAALVFKV